MTSKVVGARMAGSTIEETAQLLRISRGTVSKVKTAYERDCKNSAAKHKSDHSSSLPLFTQTNVAKQFKCCKRLKDWSLVLWKFF